MSALAVFRRVYADQQHEKAQSPLPLWAWRWGPALGSFVPGIVIDQPNRDRLAEAFARYEGSCSDLGGDESIYAHPTEMETGERMRNKSDNSGTPLF